MMSLSNSIDKLNEIVTAFENDEPVNADDYALTVSDTKEAIDKRVWLIKRLESEIILVKARAEELKNRANKLDNLTRRIKDSIVYTIEHNQHLDFQGNEYRLKVVNNGGKQAVTCAFGIELSEIRKVVQSPAHFAPEAIETITCYVLKPGIEDKVRSGEQVKGLELQPRGKSLRIS
jgi:sugar-specific transcriptional regulator TrmB